MAALVLLGLAALGAARELVVVAPLGSGLVYAFDLADGNRVATLPAEDGAGLAGIALSPDGGFLYVVDGNVQHRLRRFDTNTWREDLARDFRDRLLLLSAGPVVHLTADGRWLLIPTSDIGAAASGVRVFDTGAGEFAPVGLQLGECLRPKFASAPSGIVAAVCSGDVSLWTSRAGETLSPAGRGPTGVRVAAAVALTPDGATLLALGTRSRNMPWHLARVSVRTDRRVAMTDLKPLLRVAATREEDSSPSVMDLDVGGTRVVIVNGQNVWLLGLSPLRVRESVRLPGPASGAKLSADGRLLYTLRRDSSRLLLRRTNLETGAAEEFVLFSDLPLAPLAWHFSLGHAASR